MKPLVERVKHRKGRRLGPHTRQHMASVPCLLDLIVILWASLDVTGFYWVSLFCVLLFFFLGFSGVLSS